MGDVMDSVNKEISIGGYHIFMGGVTQKGVDKVINQDAFLLGNNEERNSDKGSKRVSEIVESWLLNQLPRYAYLSDNIANILAKRLVEEWNASYEVDEISSYDTTVHMAVFYKGSIRPFLDGGSQEKEHRAGTENIASIVAMACALEKNCTQIDRNEKHLKNLEKIIISILRDAGLDFIQNGSENRIPGNISLSFADAEGEMLLHRLDLKKICLSTGSACDSVNTQISHVIEAIGVPAMYAEGTIRITLGKNNTESEAKIIAEALVDVLRKP